MSRRVCMEKYHMRRRERAIGSRKKMLDLIEQQEHMTIAMCKAGRPYLVTINYSFDRKTKCLFFHCAPKGTKVDYLKANPHIWGQVIQDNGYIQSKCDYAYKTVMFSGTVEFVRDVAEKRRALDLMIDKLESAPVAMKKRSLTDKKLNGVTICKISIEDLSGKESVIR